MSSDPIFQSPRSSLPLPDEFDEDMSDECGVYSLEAFGGPIVAEPAL